MKILSRLNKGFDDDDDDDDDDKLFIFCEFLN